MRVEKVFNNNAILGVDPQGRETVLLGKGIGFQVRSGDPVDEERAERRFFAGSASAERLAALAAEITIAEIATAEEILTLARERLGDHLADHVLVPLVDHVHFAIERSRTGAEIEYPLSWEVENLYPTEVEVGHLCLDLIEDRLAVRLHRNEAVPLALHFVNAQFGSGDMDLTVKMTQALTAVLEILAEDFGVRIDERSVPVARFVTHLRYLFIRKRNGTMFLDGDHDLRQAVKAAKPQEYASAERVAERMHELFGWRVTGEEKLYLALHFTRLTAHAGQEGD